MIIGNAISPYALKRVYGGGGSVTPTDYLLRALDLDNEFIPMDGANLVSFEGELHLIFGWNGSATPNSQKTHWKSTDGGYSWTDLTDFPGTERHSAGAVVFGGKIWIFGGDFLKDVWTYDSTNGWVEVTSDWGIGDRGLFAYWTDGTYIYIAGGQDGIAASNFWTDVYRTSNGTSWTKVGDLPAGNASTATAYYDGANVYICGGGQGIGGFITNYNTSIYKSVDNGANWTTLGTSLPVGMRNGYPNGIYWDSKYWYLCGDIAGDNQPYLYYTTDFTSWTALYDNPTARHASALAIQDDKLYIVQGNLWNDSYAIEKVAQTTGVPTGAAACFTIFKLFPDYTGYCKRIERSSDNDFLDIGFDVNGYLNIGDIIDFTGIGESRVIIDYDITGNGNDVSTDFADAPVICTSGAMNLENNLAALLCNGSKQLSLGAPLSLGTTHSVHVVCNMTSYSSIVGANSTYAFYPTATDICYYNSSGSYAYNYSGDIVPFPLNQQVLVEIYRVNETVQMFRNGIKMGNASACNIDNMTPNSGMTIENLFGEAGYQFTGNMQTILIYSNDQLTKRKGIADTLMTLHGI